MSFWDHIEVLRWHLIRALIGVALCLVVGLFEGARILEFLLGPLRRGLEAHQAGNIVIQGIVDGLAAFLRISLIGGILLASPWVLYQLWAFVAPGLYAHEKRLVYRCVPALLGLFAAGVMFGWLVALPGALDFMIQFNLGLGLQLQITAHSWVSFALIFPLAFGIAFELPLVMVLLAKIGLMTGQDFRRHRRMAILVAAIVSAVLTPTTDPVGMMFMFLPMVVLYEAGIWSIWLIARMPASAKQHEEHAGSEDLLGALLVPLVCGSWRDGRSTRCMRWRRNLT
jgi:Tat protein translocase TatC